MDSNDPIVARLQRDTQRSMEAVLDMVRYRQMIVVETREQIAREIEAEAKRSELIEESRYSEEYEYEFSRIASFNGGHIGGLTTAAAIARGEK